jgi:hypothetical protein
MSNDINSDQEEVGVNAYSILTSQLAFSSMGADKKTLFSLKRKIDGISATLWSILIFSFQREKEEIETLSILKKQLEHEIKTILDLSDQLSMADLTDEVNDKKN